MCSDIIACFSLVVLNVSCHRDLLAALMDHLESSWAWLSIAVLSLECSKGYFFYFYTEVSRNPLVFSCNNSDMLVLLWKAQPQKLPGSIFSVSRVLNLSSQNLPLRKRSFTGNSRWVTMIICLEGEGRITLTCSTEQYCSRSDVHSAVSFAWLNMITISRWSLDTQVGR